MGERLFQPRCVDFAKAALAVAAESRLESRSPKSMAASQTAFHGKTPQKNPLPLRFLNSLSYYALKFFFLQPI